MALLLSDADVASLLPMREALEVVEDAFRQDGLGRAQMPPKSYLFFDNYNGDLRIMPAYILDRDAAGVKIVNSHPRNRERYGLPTVMATLILVDPKSGLPKALMGANTLTAIRTGAAGGLAAKYLARRDSEVAGFVGAGVQACAQLEALMETVPGIRMVRVYDIDPARAAKFLELPHGRGIRAEVAKSVEDAAKGSDVLVTTTPSRQPIVKRKWIDPGTHINAIGADAPGKQELEIEILLGGKVVPDSWEQASHGGEMNVAVAAGLLTKDMVHGELGQIACGKLAGRQSDEEITVFDSTGLAIQDIAVAAHICGKAGEDKKGVEVQIWSV